MLIILYLSLLCKWFMYFYTQFFYLKDESFRKNSQKIRLSFAILKKLVFQKNKEQYHIVENISQSLLESNKNFEVEKYLALNYKHHQNKFEDLLLFDY